jgi:hypothetical protein
MKSHRCKILWVLNARGSSRLDKAWMEVVGERTPIFSDKAVTVTSTTRAPEGRR